MKAILALFVFSTLTFFVRIGLADAPLANPYQQYAVSVFVGGSQGSGLLLRASNSLYLVTARHVVFIPGAGAGLWSARGPVMTINGNVAGEKSETVIVADLSQLSQSGEVRCSNDHDIAMVRLEVYNGTNSPFATALPGVSFGTDEHTLAPFPVEACRRFDETDVGTDVYIFGFPGSVGLAEMPQIDLKLPLLRKGIVAGKNPVRRVYVLDCASYQGNSGGPVVGKEPEGLGYTRFPILGIVTEMVPYSETWQNTRLGYSNQNISNSGYSIAEPIDCALDMVWK